MKPINNTVRALIATSTLSISLIGGANAANLVINGDFENGISGGAPSSWTLVSGNYSLNQANYHSSFPTIALDLGTFASSEISQNINLVAGCDYTLSLETYDFRSQPDSTVSHQFSIDGNTFDVLALGSQTIETQSFSFTASTSGLSTLSLATVGGSSPDANNWIDNIAIEKVPEPSSTALLGLGGLALILRRRRIS